MVKFDDRGLIPALVQDASTGDVLTLAYMNEEALRRSIAGPDVWFYSRSRAELWHKGETSGNYLKVKEIIADCDSDAVLVKVEPTGPACHTGNMSCFDSPLRGSEALNDAERRAGPGVLAELMDVIEQRKRDRPEGSYTTRLFDEGAPRIAQKVVEESGEVVIAALTGSPQETAAEASDLLYHLLVLLAASDVPMEQVWDQLLERRGSPVNTTDSD